MRDYSTQAARHRRPEKKGPSAAVGITLSIVLLGAVATGTGRQNSRRATRTLGPLRFRRRAHGRILSGYGGRHGIR